jgi:hypothetical protein
MLASPTAPLRPEQSTIYGKCPQRGWNDLEVSCEAGGCVNGQTYQVSFEDRRHHPCKKGKSRAQGLLGEPSDAESGSLIHRRQTRREGVTMSRRCYMLLLALPLLALFLGSTCRPSQSGENLLERKQWTQLQSDEQGTGFNGVHTSRAVLPLRRWTAGIGDVAFASPVVDVQGRIWVGNVAGELVGKH